MSQSFFQQAASLNNEGVNALANGDETTSIALLTNTVEMMRQYVASPEQANELASCSGQSSSCFESFTTVEIPISLSDENMFFHQAITMPCELQDSSPLDAYVYSAAVIFNLALAFHVQGIAKSNSSNKAEKLYDTIIKLLDGRVGHMESALLLKLY